MSEYIKREDALNAIEVCVNESVMPEEWRSGMLDAYDEVKSYVPSADVVEVVRCKDCIHNDQCKHRVVMWVEDPINTWHKDIDFCSYGERKEQEHE
jgi:hypothetical protein